MLTTSMFKLRFKHKFQSKFDEVVTLRVNIAVSFGFSKKLNKTQFDISLDEGVKD